MNRFIRMILICMVVTLLFAAFGAAQEAITVTRTAWVKVAGNDIFDSGDISHPLQILKWRGQELAALQPWRPGLNEKIQLLATYGSISGDFFVCYNRSSMSASPLAVIEKRDFDKNSHRQVWANGDLFPRSIAIGPNGYVYLLGLSRKDEEKLFFNLNENESVTLDLLHIFSPNGLELRSMIPLSITGRNKEAVLTLMRKSSFAFKKNGNFFLIFNPFTANHRGWGSLVNRNATEYASNGEPVRSHSFPYAPPDSVLASLVIDGDDSLIVQFIDYSYSQPNQEGITNFKWRTSFIFRVPAGNGVPEPILKDITGHELIMAIFANGKILTQVMGRNIVHIWSR